MPYFDERRETMARDELRLLQLERLQSTVSRAHRNVTFYRHIFDEHNITPEQFAGLEDLQRLPFTTREDLRESYPYEMFAVPLREIVRIHSSSGSTGPPTVVGYTANDLEHWTDLVARNLVATGVGADDVVQVFFGYGLFSGGFGLHQGAERLGASVLPASNADVRKQIAVMQDFRTTVLVGTPSYARQIAEMVASEDISAQSLSLRVGLFGGEQWSERIRELIEHNLLISAYDIYGLAELGGPGVAGECEKKSGLHIAEDSFIPQVIDPDTGELLEDGEEGELVLTAIEREAFPLLRYRTGDITSLTHEPCACGRTLARMSRVMRRTDDMIIVQGMKMFPDDFRQVIDELDIAGPRFRIVLDRQEGEDTVEVQIELSAPPASGVLAELDGQRKKVQERLRKHLRIPVSVRFVEPSSMPPMRGKDNVVEDNRQI